MFTSCGSASKLSKADTPWTYEIESVGVGADGTYAIRVWSYYKNAKMPLEVAKLRLGEEATLTDDERGRYLGLVRQALGGLP